MINTFEDKVDAFLFKPRYFLNQFESIKITLPTILN